MEENSQNIEQANDDFLEMETPDKEPKKQDGVVKKNKKAVLIFVGVVALIIAIKVFKNNSTDVNTTAQNQPTQSTQEAKTQAQQVVLQQEKSQEEQEKNQKQQNIIQEEADEMALIEQRAQEKINWQKRISKFFINDKNVKFNLIENGNKIAIILDNFKQEPENQNKITGVDGRVSKLELAPNNDGGFLDIILQIESTPPTQPYVLTKKYPLLDHLKLEFYEDSIVKTTSAGDEVILTIGDKILPYITINDLGKTSSGKIFVVLDVEQSHLGSKDFVFRYETNEQ